MNKISEKISYIPATDNPLSSDVTFIHGDTYEWIFDVGSSREAADAIQKIDREKHVVLSHFHKDHTDNLEFITCKEIYCGAYTKKKFGKGVEVKEPITFEDGIKITIFPIPSPHSKGSVGLEVNEEYAFLGDAVYGAPKNGRMVFNVNLLKETIDVLESLKAEKFLVSHEKKFVKSKAEVIDGLKKLYEMREAKEMYLYL